VFVKDFIEETYSIAEAGTHTILFDQPWNNSNDITKNCKFVYGWGDILLLIKELEE
tara:strand:+ start:59 stop:226 length:168 start_codon:yes stop_codon:yes gene_type:complete